MVVFHYRPHLLSPRREANICSWEDDEEVDLQPHVAPGFHPSIRPSLRARPVSPPPLGLHRTFIMQTALLIKELIFSLLSVISTANLKLQIL